MRLLYHSLPQLLRIGSVTVGVASRTATAVVPTEPVAPTQPKRLLLDSQILQATERASVRCDVSCCGSPSPPSARVVGLPYPPRLLLLLPVFLTATHFDHHPILHKGQACRCR